MGLLSFLIKKNKITILLENWEVLYTTIVLSSVPNENDFIFDDKTNSYYKVIKVIFPINKKNNICIVVTKLNDEINEHL